ncbi:hypothetical protein BD289DRAFT_229555 [Coniella lustricola]|uniref:Uncharacterized protein n=1 Tax=Coniella lustricola TaxID=2025994 RepID=A0A2T2ZRV1_9PEZI|nr:hypothetical protein BD289DRAFT_229555 [Coniella lustricola]
MAHHTSSTSNQWTFILAVTALFLSAVVTLQILSSYAKAYVVAPAEILTFIDAADSSVDENESYDRDVSRVQRLDDKLRLGRLLREIQKGGDDLREELNTLLMTENGDLASDGYSDLRDLRLRATARLLWASKRKGLEDKVRRLDMLRMRFLVVYMGIVSMSAAESAVNGNKLERKNSARDSEKGGDKLFNENYGNGPPAPPLPPLPSGLGDAIKKKPMLRRMSGAATGHSDNSERSRKQQGWAGVIRELQLSPLLHKRHASIERAMSPSPTLVGSPTPGSSPRWSQH